MRTAHPTIRPFSCQFISESFSHSVRLNLTPVCNLSDQVSTITNDIPIWLLFVSVQLVDILVFLVFCEFKNKQWGILLSIGVLLHWFIDAMVHVGDMPIFHDSIKVGLGLWQFPWLAYLLELAVFIVAGYFLLRNYNNVKRHIILIVLLSAGLSSMFFAPEAEVSTDVVSITSLSLYVISALFAYWSER